VILNFIVAYFFLPLVVNSFQNFIFRDDSQLFLVVCDTLRCCE